ncbi:hypothetical protein [Pseudoroseicyclus tamaricis]|nr:hypothetical protein [Pseudoroseicyclus tamaricis]
MRGKSLLIMAFGQSNADVHNAGPRLEAPPLEDPRLVVPDDGHGFRGLMGQAPKGPITGFEPFAPHERRVMSLTAAAGARVLHEMGPEAPARVILRSGAKGGRRLLGLRQGAREVDGLLSTCSGDLSPLFEAFLRVTSEVCDAAMRDGPEVGAIAFLFAHGESERQMVRAEYAARLGGMMDVTADVLAPLGLPMHWHLVQAAGPGAEGAGNAWPNRLALADVATARGDATLAAAGYPWPLEDGVHYSAEGKALLGEALGRSIAAQLSGQPRTLPHPVAAVAEGARLLLDFAGEGPLALDHAPASGRHGFEMARGEVTGVRVDGRRVEVTLAEPASGPEGLSYAWSSWAKGTRLPAIPGAALGGGGLRSAEGVASILLPGRKIYDWVPGFSL